MFQGRNGIIFEMLEAVYFLCERNVYLNNEHVDEIIKHLFEILNGSTDRLSPGIASDLDFAYKLTTFFFKIKHLEEMRGLACWKFQETSNCFKVKIQYELNITEL